MDSLRDLVGDDADFGRLYGLAGSGYRLAADDGSILLVPKQYMAGLNRPSLARRLVEANGSQLVQ